MNTVASVLALLIFSGWAVSSTAAPIEGDDIVTVDGTEWAQVDLFLSSTFQDMLTACPTGDCLDGAMLSGYDMSGWTWATVDDIYALFNYYINLNHPVFIDYYPMGPGQPKIEELFANFTLDFFDDGWRPTSDVLTNVQTTTTEGWFFANSEAVSSMWVQYFPSDPVGNYSIADTSNHPNYADVGGWFYRPVDTDGDGVPDSEDAYPSISLEGRLDTDHDGIPNDCEAECLLTGMLADTDDDADGHIDTADNCPLIPNPDQADSNNNGIGNLCEIPGCS
jgi:hypothetical protein